MPSQLALRRDANQRRDRGAQLPIAFILVGVLDPEYLYHLIGKDIVPVIRLGAADIFKGALAIVRIVGEHGCRRVRGFLDVHREVLSRYSHR